MGVFIIAEAGVNHNGDLDIARKLVEVAARSGADAVKFQTFKADSTVGKGTATVAYQRKSTGQDSQHELLKRLELSEADHLVLVAYARELGIEFMSTAFDLESAKFLVTVGIKRIKIPSGEVTNIPFIENLAADDLDIILSTGMADIDEIALAVDAIKRVRQAKGFMRPLADCLTILHCTSAYPTPSDQLNLAAISTISKEFSVPVGYSDHSSGLEAAWMAVALGAQAYEKHFTLDRNMEGPDHAASLEPDELIALVKQIRLAENMLGSGEKIPQPCEIEARGLVRRSLFAARDLPKGTKIEPEDIVILRPESGLAPKHFDKLIGSQTVRNIAQGSPFEQQDINV